MTESIRHYDGNAVRIILESGEFFEGEAEMLPAEYCLHELGREENALQISSEDEEALIDNWVFYESDSFRIELIEEGRPGASPRMVYYAPKEDVKTSHWSGGSTTQFLIYPWNGDYARREFLWRISSATVDIEESDFTALPDYERFITPLEGEMVLEIDGAPAVRLEPLEILGFDGASATHSRGLCRDFNLMLRKGKAAGGMDSCWLSEEWEPLSGFPEAYHLLYYCPRGSCRIKTPYSEIRLDPEQPLLMIENPGDLLLYAQGAPGTALVSAWAARR